MAGWVVSDVGLQSGAMKIKVVLFAGWIGSSDMEPCSGVCEDVCCFCITVMISLLDMNCPYSVQKQRSILP